MEEEEEESSQVTGTCSVLLPSSSHSSHFNSYFIVALDFCNTIDSFIIYCIYTQYIALKKKVAKIFIFDFFFELFPFLIN